MRLSRAKGFRLQAASLALNGLPAVVVARPTRWGNHYRVGPAVTLGGCSIPEITPERAVALHRSWIEQALRAWPSTAAAIEALRGYNLACWCNLDHPCHGDTLLELANR
jgi:hypothetical protein